MAQIITFSVSEDGKISPSTVQKAGVQGNHNITEVRFNVEEALVSGALEESPTSRIRMQFVDGAGGFYSTGFLDAIAEILPDASAQYYVTCPIPNNVTNAGGLAYVYLVVTEIVYEDGKALENQVYISPPGKLLYIHSGVGSPSEYAYKVGITNALVNAEIFAGQAEGYAIKSLGYSNTAGKYAENAADSAADAVTSANNAAVSEENAATSEENAAESATSAKKSEESANYDAVSANIAASVAQSRAEEAANSLQELKDGIANGDFKGEKGDKGEPGETPSLDGVIQYWQPNTEYKVGDVCLAIVPTNIEYFCEYQLIDCVEAHISSDSVQDDIKKLRWLITFDGIGKSFADAYGNAIHEHYATKEDLAEAIGQALEGDY
ncbi:MAG: hypothetical protein U0L88_04125 [Acutalibacteraceae bacterium]|nr:hypothetical protein [Acutalibacteraceae bacterium]